MVNPEQLVKRFPLRTYFAGLEGDTLKMQQNGWELNVQTERDYRRDGLSIRITGMHRGHSLCMISGECFLDYSFAMKPQMLVQYPFEIRIEACAKNVLIQAQEKMATISRDWNGIVKSQVTQDVKSFFTFEENSGIIIPEAKILTVQEHLEAIRSIQQPTQDEILRMSLENQKPKPVLKLLAV